MDVVEKHRPRTKVEVREAAGRGRGVRGAERQFHPHDVWNGTPIAKGFGEARVRIWWTAEGTDLDVAVNQHYEKYMTEGGEQPAAGFVCCGSNTAGPEDSASHRPRDRDARRGRRTAGERRRPHPGEEEGAGEGDKKIVHFFFNSEKGCFSFFHK